VRFVGREGDVKASPREEWDVNGKGATILKLNATSC
jgi:hypothetical protein